MTSSNKSVNQQQDPGWNKYLADDNCSNTHPTGNQQSAATTATVPFFIGHIIVSFYLHHGMYICMLRRCFHGPMLASLAIFFKSSASSLIEVPDVVVGTSSTAAVLGETSELGCCSVRAVFPQLWLELFYSFAAHPQSISCS